ncbi:PmoA family protein [Cohnella caldifontis]|uniref:DUF6807 domain-containing protein n=1 Tax=Cohnella caldifontis TaxID=3027471 RepID=UPI0023EC9315|nr:PmoA family protein [Cohnella sp. YIM B05605]
MGFESHYDKKQAMWQARLNGVTVLEYIHGAAGDPNPSFREVRTPGGTKITTYRPWDHFWHTGLFFSWKYINGRNFWESMYHGQRNVAVTDFLKPLEGGRIGFRTGISYVAEDGVNLLKEKREVSVTEAEEGYLLRWQAEFTAQELDLILDRTPCTEKEPWGGYAGLSCRLERNFLGPDITTDLGTRLAEEAFGRPFRWCDYTGKLDGYTEARHAGICLMDHPENPRFPTSFLTYDYKDLQFLSAAFLFHEPYSLRSGESLSLRYALYVHDNKADAVTIERLWQNL